MTLLAFSSLLGIEGGIQSKIHETVAVHHTFVAYPTIYLPIYLSIALVIVRNDNSDSSLRRRTAKVTKPCLSFQAAFVPLELINM